MDEKLTTYNIENDQFNFDSEESEYNYLIKRLREIKKTIDLLEKTIFQ